MRAIVKRELHAIFTLRGWVYAALVLAGAAVFTLMTNLLGGATRFEINAANIALLYIPATAIVTAPAFSAERTQNTERLLYSLPVSSAAIVGGKFLSLMEPVLLATTGLCLFPIFLHFFGLTAMPAAYGSILALTFLGVACMAVGLFISSVTSKPALAFVVTLLMLSASWAAPYAAEWLRTRAQFGIPMMVGLMLIVFVITYLLSRNGVVSIILTAAAEVPMFLCHLRGTGAYVLSALERLIDALSLFEKLNPFVNGLLDGRVLLLYATVALLFVLLTWLQVKSRRQAERRAL